MQIPIISLAEWCIKINKHLFRCSKKNIFLFSWFVWWRFVVWLMFDEFLCSKYQIVPINFHRTTIYDSISKKMYHKQLLLRNKTKRQVTVLQTNFWYALSYTKIKRHQWTTNQQKLYTITNNFLDWKSMSYTAENTFKKWVSLCFGSDTVNSWQIIESC